MIQSTGCSESELEHKAYNGPVRSKKTSISCEQRVTVIFLKLATTFVSSVVASEYLWKAWGAFLT